MSNWTERQAAIARGIAKGLPDADRAEAVDRGLIEAQQRLDQRVRELDRAPYADIGDREGAPPIQDLVRAERSAFQRLNPRRDRWPELHEFEARVVDLQNRQKAVTDALTELRDRRASAPAREADALARWELDDRRGDRPASETAKIDAAIEEAQATYEGLTTATERVLEEKARFVEKHRGRLVTSAEREQREAQDRLVALVGELEQARDALIDCRLDVLYARLYPDRTAGYRPPVEQLVGGLQRPMRETLGLDVQIRIDQVWRALRADADWLAAAVNSEQRKALEGTDGAKPANTVWVDTDEGREELSRERRQALARHRERFGTTPA